MYLEFDPKRPLSEFLNFIRANRFDVVDFQMNKNKLTKNLGQCAILSLESQTKRTHEEMMELIGTAPGVQFMEEL